MTYHLKGERVKRFLKHFGLWNGHLPWSPNNIMKQLKMKTNENLQSEACRQFCMLRNSFCRSRDCNEPRKNNLMFKSKHRRDLRRPGVNFTNIVLEAFAPGRLTCCFWHRGYSVKVGCNILLCALVEFGAKLLVELNGILCNKCCVLAYLQFAL